MGQKLLQYLKVLIKSLWKIKMKTEAIFWKIAKVKCNFAEFSKTLLRVEYFN